ncbi:MAG: transposase [Patescibacteria group bacterium]|nr:transposase [Patescibacteria group bacterium]
MVVENINTASSKVYRLVSNQKILDNFPKLLVSSKLVNRTSLVNIDFSTFCGFETLSFGLQTDEGRAIPVWANCLTYPLKEVRSQNTFVISEVKDFGQTLGFYPRFVFDRGFWIPDLIKLFLEEEITFYLRIKAGKLLEESEGKFKSAKALGKLTKDTPIKLYGRTLRLVISPPPPKQIVKKEGKKAERWYILTNDLTSTREQILDIYYHRFEIEETFKDLKYVSKLKKFFIKKRLSFKTLLAFICLGFWLSFWCYQLGKLAKITFYTLTHPKKKRSYFKIWWEGIQRSLRVSLKLLDTG